MKIYYLYKITNKLTKKIYIGITSNPERRKRQHFNKTPVGTVSILKQAIVKYGSENFLFELICIGEKDYILDLEVKAIKLYQTQDKNFGYNIKQGGQSGQGYKLNYTTKDKPQYVSGFWFPNVRTALSKLDIDASTFKRRRKEGKLGDTFHEGLKQTWGGLRVYVGGFWWQDVFQASAKLLVSVEALKSRIKKGTLEQAYLVREQSGAKNHMFAIDPSEHPSSKSVLVNGVEYRSIKQATLDTGISKYLIHKYIRENKSGFSYLTY